MPVDAAFWRILRQDFETLQPQKFSLIWNSSPQPGLIGKTPGESHWSWWHFPDESLRARLSALAVRGARALGYDSEDAWYDELRESEFVRFRTMGSSRERRSDGAMVDSEFGPIHDVVKESITLCYKLEAEAVSAETPGAERDSNRTVLSWPQTRAKFLHGAEEYPNVYAHWESNQELWTLRDLPTTDAGKPADPQSEQLFNEAAQAAVRLLRSSSVLTPGGHASMSGKSSEVWLNLMRENKRGFLWRSRPMSGFRQATRLQESNWLEGVEEPTELARIGSDLSGIPHVFKESADFCDDLAFRDRASLSLDERSSATREDASAQQNESAKSSAFINLTAEQKDLLRLLVSNHEKTGGAEFFLTRSLTSAGITYPSGLSIPITHDDSDFKQLQSDGLISFYPVSQGVYRGKPTQLGITFVRRGFALFDAESPPKEGEAPPARQPVVAKSDLRTDRPSLVDDFLHRCNEESTVGFKVKRKHIWLAVGHAHPRQFQYWQEGSDKATDEDDRNFRRILSMSPGEFLSLLRKKRISPPNS